ncbi:MAG: AraC family transcriptional regulator [Oscillospiraceae bacterium]|nr:MAG: AraC family transcriptional regulator [Oscillospiraceae bacterium]
MKIKHRYNSAQRQHYLLEAHYSFKLKPRLLYVGSLDKHGGWREEPHAHDFFEMVFITDGHGTAIIGESEHELSRGDILIYNAGISHYERSRMDDPMEACFIAYDKLEITDLPPNWLLPSSYGCFFPAGDMYGIFDRLFSSLLREFEQKERFYMEIAQNMSRTLLMYLFRLINKTENAENLLDSGRILDTVINYINLHYTQEITLEDLARECYANKYYLSHLFSRVRGESIGKYIQRRRLCEAKRLLAETDNSVRKIAEAVGFPDNSYFCRVFKKETGVTPLTFRAGERKNADK